MPIQSQPGSRLRSRQALGLHSRTSSRLSSHSQTQSLSKFCRWAYCKLPERASVRKVHFVSDTPFGQYRHGCDPPSGSASTITVTTLCSQHIPPFRYLAGTQPPPLPDRLARFDQGANNAAIVSVLAHSLSDSGRLQTLTEICLIVRSTVGNTFGRTLGRCQPMRLFMWRFRVSRG